MKVLGINDDWAEEKQQRKIETSWRSNMKQMKPINRWTRDKVEEKWNQNLYQKKTQEK